MVGLALCLPSVGQPQGLPVPRKIPKAHNNFESGIEALPVNARPLKRPLQTQKFFGKR
jgi:hypothetical protein